jgi:hypothetical protein
MDDEVVTYELKPYRHTKLSLVGAGLHFASDTFDNLGSLFGALAMMTLQTQMQHDIDRKFEKVMKSGS